MTFLKDEAVEVSACTMICPQYYGSTLRLPFGNIVGQGTVAASIYVIMEVAGRRRAHGTDD